VAEYRRQQQRPPELERYSALLWECGWLRAATEDAERRYVEVNEGLREMRVQYDRAVNSKMQVRVPDTRAASPLEYGTQAVFDWCRRVQLVRRDGRDVSTLYGRGGVEQVDSVRSALTPVRGAQAEALQRNREANLSLAGGLVKGLRAQQRRWSKALEAHPIDANKLAGACSLAAAFLCYAGPLSAPFRARALAEPMQLSCRQANVLLKVCLPAPARPLVFALRSATVCH
jgi:hypothetical protein